VCVFTDDHFNVNKRVRGLICTRPSVRAKNFPFLFPEVARKKEGGRGGMGKRCTIRKTTSKRKSDIVSP